MKTLSLAMIVKNESRCLARCLESIKDLVDEMIIVDTGSTDKTKEIAYSYGAKVYDYVWNNDFAAARNYSLKQTTGNWCLVLDADEIITYFDKVKVTNFMNDYPNTIGRIAIWSETGEDQDKNLVKDYNSRLLPKGAYYEGIIHEQPNQNYKRVNVEIEAYHDGYILEFKENKFDRNIKLLFRALEKNLHDKYLYYQIARTYHVSKRYEQADEYFKKWIETSDFTSSYSNTGVISYLNNLRYLSQYKKALELIVKYKNLLDQDSDYYYTCGLFYLDLVLADPNKYQSYLKEIEISYLKALNLGDTGCIHGSGTFLAAYNLGVFYETTKEIELAKQCYQICLDSGYEKGKEGLLRLRDI